MNAQDKIKLLKDVERIGKNVIKNKEVPAQDTIGTALIDYWVHKNIESYAKKAKEKALKSVLVDDLVLNNVNVLVAATKKLNEGSSSVVASGADVQLICKTKRGARKFELPLLTKQLVTKYRMKAADVEALIESCYTQNDPAKEYDVIEKD